MMEEIRPDLISNLPDDLRRYIIALLPLEDAGRTTILSSSWRNFWKLLTVKLPADSDQFIISTHESSRSFHGVISKCLKPSHDSPQVLKISFSHHQDGNDLDIMAIYGVCEDLQLVLSNARKEMTYDMKLKPTNNPTSCSLYPFGKTIFSSLKILHLRCISNGTEHVVPQLFSSCCFLEILKLEKCIGLKKLNVSACNSLEKVSVINCPDITSITLAAPNLKSLYYKGALPIIELESAKSLADVTLDLGEGLGKNVFDCEDVLSFFESIRDIKILTVSGWLIQWMCTAGVIFERLFFQFNKLQELWWIDSLMDRRKCSSLACFLNFTPFLEKLIINIDSNRVPVSCPHNFHQCWHEPHLHLDFAKIIKFKFSQLKNLQMNQSMGHTTQEDELLWMDLLLLKTSNL